MFTMSIENLWDICACDCDYCKAEGTHYLGVCWPTDYGSGCKKWKVMQLKPTAIKSEPT